MTESTDVTVPVVGQELRTASAQVQASGPALTAPIQDVGEGIRPARDMQEAMATVLGNNGAFNKQASMLVTGSYVDNHEELKRRHGKDQEELAVLRPENTSLSVQNATHVERLRTNWRLQLAGAVGSILLGASLNGAVPLKLANIDGVGMMMGICLMFIAYIPRKNA